MSEPNVTVVQLPRLLLRGVEFLARRAGLAPTPSGVAVPWRAAIVDLGTLTADHADLIEHTVVDGHPADDLPFTIRVHHDDDPLDPGARRYFKDDSRGKRQWAPATGWARHLAAAEESGDPEYQVFDLTNEQVMKFPRQPFELVAALMAKGVRR